jgi:hypothetical protein
MWLVSGSTARPALTLTLTHGQALFNQHRAPVAALVSCGAILVSVAPGDGVLALFCAPSSSAAQVQPPGTRPRRGERRVRDEGHEEPMQVRAHTPRTQRRAM